MVINQLKTKKGQYGMLLFIVVILFSCSSTKKETVTKENPPGTIWLRDNLYMDATPICNVYYREYEYSNRNYSKYNFSQLDSVVNSLPYFGFDIKSYLHNSVFTPNPDSAKYKIDLNKFQSNSSLLSYMEYGIDRRYEFYPIMNMPYLGAISFCKWRTAMMMLSYASIKTYSKRAVKHKKIKYRLPTKEEWEYAVTHLPIKFSFNENISYSGKGIVTQVFNDPIYGVHNYDSKSIFLNDLSEMVSEKNIAKGRNWNDSTSWKNVNFTTSYQDASNWLTFRCICEVED